MNKDRLLHLKEILHQVEPEKFDMSSWFVSHKTNHYCQTAACAFGYAALDPCFKEQGLQLVSEGNAFNSLIETFDLKDHFYNHEDKEDGLKSAYGVVKYKHYYEFSAAEHFFDLSRNDSIFIFGESSYDTSKKILPSDVINHISILLERKKN